MSRLTTYVAMLALVCALPTSTGAQDEQDDSSFLERLIEDSLSGDDRDVVIEGFQGLLSGQATFDRLTISDRDGIWLTVTDAELDWSRLALLRSRLEVSRLRAASIDVPRPPAPAQTTPSPEASGGFALPELPVAIRVDDIGVGQLTLGEALFGQAATLQIAGSAVLEGGAGTVDIGLDRTDGDGRFELAGSYTNETDILDLTLLVDEAANGIVVNLINVPELPSLRLIVSGEAPLSDFAADILLASDGVDRLAGRVATSVSGTPDARDRAFSATLGGDITALFLPEYRDFFGPNLSLAIDATRRSDGAVDIGLLDLQAQSVFLSGSLSVGSSGLPTQIDLDGQIFSRDDGPVTLPLSGAPVSVGSAQFDIAFDEAQGQTWTATIDVEDLNASGYGVDSAVLDGGGTIDAASGARSVTAALDFEAAGLALPEGTAQALGDRITGSTEIAWSEGAPLTVSDLDLTGPNFDLTANATIDGFASGLTIDADGAIDARDLSRFSALAGRPLTGALSAETSATYAALTGEFNLTVDALADGLSLAIPQIDPLLAGQADLTVAAVRDTAGTRVDVLRLSAPAIEIDGSADLRTQASVADLTVALPDAGVVLSGVDGPFQLTANLRQSGDIIDAVATATGQGIDLDIDGTADLSGEVPRLAADLDARLRDLGAFSTLAGRDLAGAITASGRAEAAADLSEAIVDLSGALSNIALGIPQVDALLAGRSTFALRGNQTAEGPVVEELRLDAEAIDLDGSADLRPGQGAVDVTLAIADASVLLPDAAGAIRLAGRADEAEDGDWQFDVTGAAPGLDLSADGTTRPFDSPITADAAINLSAPDLTQLSSLIGRPIGGSVTLDGRVAGASDLSALEIDVAGQARSLATGIADIDRLLGGRADLIVDVSVEDQELTIREAAFDSAQLTIDASGTSADGSGTLTLSAALADVGLFAPDFPGRAAIDGTAEVRGGDTVELDFSATGPGGIAADLTGTVATEANTLDVELTGRAPLGLANRALSPISVTGDVGFDFDVVGPPDFNSVSGQITSSGGRIVIPQVGVTLANLATNSTISNGAANLSVTTAVEGGGAIAIEGPVTLSAPFDGNLGITLDRVALTDGSLYETSVSGGLRIAGPLTGGASISGDLSIGETEVNIAGTGAGASGAIPEIEHINEPARVLRTREFAGLVRSEDDGPAQVPAYPLDVGIDVTRVFVRGRGLDVEMAGGLRVTGTTANVEPVGEIDLVRGRLNVLGSRLVVSEGAIFLEGSLIPVIRIEAQSNRRSNDGVETFVRVEGPVTDPDVQFLSDPSLPEDEVLARLLFGTDLANISALQAAQLASAAATLSGRTGPGVIGGLREGLGVDDLDFRTDEEGNTEVSAGVYLNENLYADVTTRTNGESEVNLNLDLTERITVTGSTSNTGESTVGIFFKRNY